MTVPALQPASTDIELSGLSLEAAGLEIALQSSRPEDFARVLAGAGARLLFRMNTGVGEGGPYVAAVAVGEGAQREFLIVTRPAEGAVSVEPAVSSESPVARLAPSFVAVMERWPAAV